MQQDTSPRTEEETVCLSLGGQRKRKDSRMEPFGTTGDSCKSVGSDVRDRCMRDAMGECLDKCRWLEQMQRQETEVILRINVSSGMHTWLEEEWGS